MQARKVCMWLCGGSKSNCMRRRHVRARSIVCGCIVKRRRIEGCYLMFRWLHAIQVWREEQSVMTDDDFEQTPANIREYKAFRSRFSKYTDGVSMAYTGFVILAVTAMSMASEPVYWRLQIGVLLLYGVGLLGELRIKTEETLLIQRLRTPGNTTSQERVRQRWMRFFRRVVIVFLAYEALSLLAWLLKL